MAQLLVIPMGMVVQTNNEIRMLSLLAPCYSELLYKDGNTELLVL